MFLKRGAPTAHIVPGGDRVVIYDSTAAAGQRTAVTAPASPGTSNQTCMRR